MRDNLHDIREMNKIGPDSYLEEYEFPDLEKLLENAIEKLHSEFEIAKTDYEEAVEKESNK